MKNKLIILIACIFLIILVLIICFWIHHKREIINRASCLSVLRSTGAVIGLYCSENNGNLPQSLSVLHRLGYLGDNANWYICPWNRKKPGDWDNIDNWMDYIYIHWKSTKGEYIKYPLMYDRRLSNHRGKGINILLVDQAVNTAFPANPETFHGQFFWDEGAQWLKKFAKDHPECNIPLPEDLDKR